MNPGEERDRTKGILAAAVFLTILGPIVRLYSDSQWEAIDMQYLGSFSAWDIVVGGPDVDKALAARDSALAQSSIGWMRAAGIVLGLAAVPLCVILIIRKQKIATGLMRCAEVVLVVGLTGFMIDTWVRSRATDYFVGQAYEGAEAIFLRILVLFAIALGFLFWGLGKFALRR
ncbi:hypothetical protein [Mesorhizobium sp. M0296]|uniref:hypothetical protein n=1 Tax=Mesorhizobium sp. M0296 TaxID=2956931 RepID=UPI00333DA4E5